MHSLLFIDHLRALGREILDKREGQGLGDRQIALMRNRVGGKREEMREKWDREIVAGGADR